MQQSLLSHLWLLKCFHPVICRFTTLESGLACLVSLLLYWGHQRFAAILRWRRNRKKELQQPLLQKEALHTQPAVSQERKTWKQLSVLAWPGVLNMLSIIVQGMGLQYISASVSQMLSGDALLQQPAKHPDKERDTVLCLWQTEDVASMFCMVVSPA